MWGWFAKFPLKFVVPLRAALRACAASPCNNPTTITSLITYKTSKVEARKLEYQYPHALKVKYKGFKH